MAQPRPYGVGPYGRGQYERYSGTIHECAGISSIVLSARATAQNVVRWGARTSLTFSAQGSMQKTLEAHGATGITFSVAALGVQRIIGAEAISQIAFNAWAFSALTWDIVGVCPCEPGEWTDADDCLPGLWVPPQPGAPGAWVASEAPASAWAPISVCSPGTWTGVRP